MKRKKSSNGRHILTCVFLALCAIAAIQLPFAPSNPESYAGQPTIVQFLAEFKSCFAATGALPLCVCFLFFYCLADRASGYHSRKTRFIPMDIVCLLLSVILLFGKSFQVDNTLDSLTSYPAQILKSALTFVGFFWLLALVCHGLQNSLLSKAEAPLGNRGSQRLSIFRGTLLIMVCWLPYLIVAFPGYICPDATWQLAQFFGTTAMTAHHPPLQTLLMGGITQAGISLFGARTGLFMYSCFQFAAFSVVLGYVISIMVSMKPPRWLLVGFCMAIAISPYYTNGFTTMLKDSIYAYSLLLLIAETVQLLRGNTERRHFVLLGISIFCVVCLRNEGKYVVAPFIVALWLFALKRRLNPDSAKRSILRVSAALLVPVLVGYLLNSHVSSAYHIQQGSIREALSLPFQQTARYVLYHEDVVTMDEKEAIAAVLDYDHLKENYNPRISDPVKRTFNNQAGSAELKAYIQVWLKQGLKHPGTYVCATLNQVYYLVYPFIENAVIYSKTLPQFIETDVFAEQVGTHLGLSKEGPSPLKNAMNAWYQLCYSLPVFGLLSSTSVYVFALLFGICISLRKRQYRWLIPVIPLIMCCGIIVLAPAILGHPRYAYPVIYSMPLLLSWLSELLRSSENQTRKENALRSIDTGNSTGKRGK